jgi:hypothetical protein
MSTKRAVELAEIARRGVGVGLARDLNPENPAVTSATALAVTVALLRALRDRGLLSDGEIDDLFGEAAEHLRYTSSAQTLLNQLQFWVEHKNDE